MLNFVLCKTTLASRFSLRHLDNTDRKACTINNLIKWLHTTRGPSLEFPDYNSKNLANFHFQVELDCVAFQP